MKIYMRELEKAREIAHAAGGILMKHYRNKSTLQKHLKSREAGVPRNMKEVVTRADEESDEYIRQRLRQLFAADLIITEESFSGVRNIRKAAERIWFVDPLDGTNEFLEEDIHEFCVMVGLVDSGKPVLGVIYNPAEDEEVYAARGAGAIMNMRRGEIRAHLEEPAEPAATKVLASRSHFPPNLTSVLARMGIPAGNTIRCGSVGVKIIRMLKGDAHIYIHTSTTTRLWDTAAADAIAREAGGSFTDCLGIALDYTSFVDDTSNIFNRKGIAAGSRRIHERAIMVMKEMAKAGELSFR